MVDEELSSLDRALLKGIGMMLILLSSAILLAILECYLTPKFPEYDCLIIIPIRIVDLIISVICINRLIDWVDEIESK